MVIPISEKSFETVSRHQKLQKDVTSINKDKQNFEILFKENKIFAHL